MKLLIAIGLFLVAAVIVMALGIAVRKLWRNILSSHEKHRSVVSLTFKDGQSYTIQGNHPIKKRVDKTSSKLSEVMATLYTLQGEGYDVTLIVNTISK